MDAIEEGGRRRTVTIKVSSSSISSEVVSGVDLGEENVQSVRGDTTEYGKYKARPTFM